MSDEGGVTSSDVTLDVTARWVTPTACKGALGTWRSPRWGPDFEPGHHHREARTKSGDKPHSSGVYVSLHLSLLENGQVPDLQAKVRTGLGKSDRPGSQGGLRKRGYGSRTEVHGESRETTTGPYGKRAEDLSRRC